MSYFNHNFQKTFVATKPTVAASGTPGQPGAQVGITDGILTTAGIHVEFLKSTSSAEGYQIGPGVVGFFDEKTNLSVTASQIATGCCSFYIASAALKSNDKQGPFHGGYAQSNKSKFIVPRRILSTYKSESASASPAFVQIGGTPSNTGGAVLTLDAGSLSGGTGYSNATDVPVTGGTGSDLTVNITQAAGVITAVSIHNPGIGYVIGDTVTITTGNADATIDILTIGSGSCDAEFICGETYYLRIDVKGSEALRALNHNLYLTVDAYTGCCADPAAPVAVADSVVYAAWAQAIVDHPYMGEFIRPILVVDGQSYAATSAIALEEGLNAADTFANAPESTVSAGLILKGAYVETKFGNCTFQPNDYYSVDPLQITASQVDYNGDPCVFEGVCVIESCPGVKASGLGETFLRHIIMSESYLQNHFATDLRIREITQGTQLLDIIDRDALYGTFYIQHEVPRKMNPSSTYDSDIYLLQIVGTAGTLAYLESEFDDLVTGGCIICGDTADYTQTGCTVPSLPTNNV